MLHPMQEAVLKNLFPRTSSEFLQNILSISYFESVTVRNKTAGLFVFTDKDSAALNSNKFKALYFGNASETLLENKDLSKAKINTFDECFTKIGEMEAILDLKAEEI